MKRALVVITRSSWFRWRRPRRFGLKTTRPREAQTRLHLRHHPNRVQLSPFRPSRGRSLPRRDAGGQEHASVPEDDGTACGRAAGRCTPSCSASCRARAPVRGAPVRSDAQALAARKAAADRGGQRPGPGARQLMVEGLGPSHAGSGVRQTAVGISLPPPVRAPERAGRRRRQHGGCGASRRPSPRRPASGRAGRGSHAPTVWLLPSLLPISLSLPVRVLRLRRLRAGLLLLRPVLVGVPGLRVLPGIRLLPGRVLRGRLRRLPWGGISVGGSYSGGSSGTCYGTGKLRLKVKLRDAEVRRRALRGARGRLRRHVPEARARCGSTPPRGAQARVRQHDVEVRILEGETVTYRGEMRAQ